MLFTARSKPSTRAGLLAALLVLSGAAACAADNSAAELSEGFRFVQKDGESLYRAVCQSCHMADGQGAKGAGMYPALAGNPKLAAGLYPAYNVLNGRKGMPGFKSMLNDDQIAAVTNYVRTNMGNAYKDTVTAAQIKAMR